MMLFMLIICSNGVYDLCTDFVTEKSTGSNEGNIWQISAYGVVQQQP